MKVKENDVFHISYTEDYRNRHKGEDLHHCFEGLVVAMKDYDEESLILVDCFWGIKRRDNYNKVFKLDDKDIILKFYCNLDEIEKSDKGKDTPFYYDENDYVMLHNQHACSENCKYWYVIKGAKPSKERLLESIKYKIEREESAIRSASWRIEQLEKEMERVNNNELENIYI